MPSHALLRPNLAAVALLLAACQFGSPGGALDVPAGVNVAATASYEELYVTWAPVAGPVGTYDVQYRLDGGAWSDPAIGVPANQFGAVLRLAPPAPEVVTVEVRVRARREVAASAFSEPVTFTRGPKPVEAIAATVDGVERVRLTWAQPSGAATEVRIERSLYDDTTGAQGPFTQAAVVPAGTTEWLDTAAVLPGRVVRYGLSNTAPHGGATVASIRLEAGPDARLGILPPSGLQAALVAGAPSLTWTNRSGGASSLQVERVEALVDDAEAANLVNAFHPVATLPPDATSWTDAVPEGPYTYRVTALAGAYPGPSAPARVVVPAAGLGVQVVRAPHGRSFLRDAGDGLWGASDRGGVKVWAPAGAGWSSHAFQPPGWLLAVQAFALDGAGRPHVLYVNPEPAPITPSATDLVHAWDDGQGWQTEVIARRSFDFGSNSLVQAYLAFDADGTPHAVWKRFDRTYPEHATRGAGGWSVETISSGLYDPVLAYALLGFAATPDGALHTLVAGPGKLILSSRPAGGAWSEEVVPTTGTVGYFEGGALLADASRVTVAYVRYDQLAARPQRLHVISRSGGVWGAPVEVTGYGAGGGTGQPTQAATDGTRMALLVPQGDPEGLWLYRSDAVGAWQATRLLTSTQWDSCGLGFHANGKIWALAPATPLQLVELPADGLRAYLTFEEP